jgi:undecaprenyl-diphosphatase
MAALDSLLFLWINATADTPPWLLVLARWMSTDLPTLALLGILPLALAGRGGRRQLLGACLAMALAWLAVRGVREAVHVARPFELGLGVQWLDHAATAGFPSFHAAVAGAWAAGLVAFARQRWRPWLAVSGGTALVIAWSRVFLGLHFVSDIAAGLLLGAMCALVARQLMGGYGRSRRAVLPAT